MQLLMPKAEVNSLVVKLPIYCLYTDTLITCKYRRKRSSTGIPSTSVQLNFNRNELVNLT